MVPTFHDMANLINKIGKQYKKHKSFLLVLTSADLLFRFGIDNMAEKQLNLEDRCTLS